MGWIRWWSDDRHRVEQDRLRAAEQHEEEAMRRLVEAGVQATIRAAEGQEAAEHLRVQFDKTREEAERVIRTAENALRLLERRDRR